MEKLFGPPGQTKIGGAPEGFDALLLASLAGAEGLPVRAPRSGSGAGGILHIARNEARLVTLAEALAFFAPHLEVLAFPAWDCVPYDRVSPHGEVVARRIETLAALATRDKEREGAKEASGSPSACSVVLTTVSAALQRVPPRRLFAGAVLSLARGEECSREDIMAFLTHNGYHRAETVREPGEYAVRGGLIDLFPPASNEPLRLDFFGDTVEEIRSFDALTQLSTGRREGIDLRPVSEVMLDSHSIRRFRTLYRDLFGAGGGADPLYEAVSAGRRIAGMEHWLPLFHDRVETIFDYLPDAAVTLDHQAGEARGARLEMIRDYYEARLSLSGVRQDPALVYKPLPCDRLYLSATEWDGILAARAVGVFSPFTPAEDSGREVDAGGRGGHDFSNARARPDVSLFDAVHDVIRAVEKEGRRVVITAYSEGSRERLSGLLSDHGIARPHPVADWNEVRSLAKGITGLAVLGLERGFSAPGCLFISEQDILGERLTRPRRKRRRAEEFIAEASSLSEGDLVVHVDHGIGRYDGLETLEISGAPHDCLQITYEGGDKLFLPVENIEVISRYGAEDTAQLDKLGGAAWQARKARVKKQIKYTADQLIRVAAERALQQIEPLVPESGIFDEFCARFPYPETEDQIRAIEETLADMESGKPMDRLICGDVGFGKTEVALRATFVAALNGVQVAVIVPTTLLCRQHLQTFRERFAGLPVRIEQLSRLTTAKRAGEVREGLKSGSVNIVIGTHALLGKNVSFNHLGLLIVDEEQHFGVSQKEQLKQLRADVRILTLTATPIPRTLQMALSGVREMSLIATPPVDRLAVRTFVLPFDPVIIREAILREHFRGGQTFYVCPRIEDLPKAEDRLRELVPEVKIAVAHGRMGPRRLEKVITAFYDGRIDVLLSTSIIESGLDIPSVNTLVVHRADMFGLSQLYQIRGRIGRAKMRAYAYLTFPPGWELSKQAQRRLEVLHNLDTLGAGFTLASHDLDIRGAGNLLGSEQSGHIREVGVELYQHMIEEAVAEARDSGGPAGEPGAEKRAWTPQISLGAPVLIPESYVADLSVRLSLYRRIAHLVDRAGIDAFAAELHDRFGALPDEANNLLDVVAIKQLCRKAGVSKVEAGPKGAVISFHHNRFANPDGLIEFIVSQAGTVKLRPDHKLVYRGDWLNAQARLTGVRNLMRRISEIAAEKSADGDAVGGDGAPA